MNERTVFIDIINKSNKFQIKKVAKIGIQHSLERLEKEMPGYYMQLIPAIFSALGLCLAAIIVRDEIGSSYRIVLYILVFVATNILFSKSLLRILSSFQMKQAIKEKNLSVLVQENKMNKYVFEVIHIISIILLNTMLWYVWVGIEDRKADLFLFIILSFQFFKGIQAKMQFNIFLNAISKG